METVVRGQCCHRQALPTSGDSLTLVHAAIERMHVLPISSIIAFSEEVYSEKQHTRSSESLQGPVAFSQGDTYWLAAMQSQDRPCEYAPVREEGPSGLIGGSALAVATTKYFHPSGVAHLVCGNRCQVVVAIFCP